MASKCKIIAVSLLLLGLGLIGNDAQAAGSSNSNRLRGTLYVVDVTAGTVTLQDASGTLTTLNVTGKTQIRRNNRIVALGDLVLGDRVTALFDSSHNATQLGARGPAVSTTQGGVGNVSSGTGIVQIETGNTSKNAPTNVQTRVVRNGQVASLRSLTLFDSVTAHLTVSSRTHSSFPGTPVGGTALDIQAEGPEESEVSGTIAAVDTGANTITITPKDGSPDVTVNVTPDTLIEVGGAPATINDLTVGMFVEAEYDPVTLNAFRIETQNEVEDGEVEGSITAIDTGLGTVTITDSNGNPVTLTVNASTKIERNDTPVILSDLQVGDPASAEFNTVTMVAMEIEVETESGGDD